VVHGALFLMEGYSSQAGFIRPPKENLGTQIYWTKNLTILIGAFGKGKEGTFFLVKLEGLPKGTFWKGKARKRGFH